MISFVCHIEDEKLRSWVVPAILLDCVGCIAMTDSGRQLFLYELCKMSMDTLSIATCYHLVVATCFSRCFPFETKETYIIYPCVDIS